MKLTAKQSKFVDAYIELGNAEQAAIKAGYSQSYARGNAHKLVANVSIKTALDTRMKSIESHKIAKADEVLRYYTSVLRGEAKETIVVGGMGGADTVEREADIKTKIAAGKELLKRYPDSDELLQAQIKRAKAEASIAEGRAAEYDHNTDGNDYKLIVDVPDKEDGKHEED